LISQHQRTVARFVLIAAFQISVLACSSAPVAKVESPAQPVTPSADTIPLRVLADRRALKLGSAVDKGFRYPGTDGVKFRSVLAREFSLLTPENDMKHERIHPGRDLYRFEPADSLVAFAEANGMSVRGHTLVWYRQLAAWLTSGSWTPDEAKALLTDHITHVVGHYKGRVLAWDVVNEALADDGTLRPGFWLDNVGRDYIELAFRTARDADPGALFFYNDYNIEGINAKSDSAYALIRDLRQKGVPIDGIGLQAHFQVGGVPASLAANIARFAALGLKVHITELDVRVPQPSTAAQLATQADNYREVFSVCLQSPSCQAIVLWGFTDRESWIPGSFPGWGEALPFDASYQPKPAYWSIYNILAGR
jgi:endo-1,4-beta-xylanase